MKQIFVLCLLCFSAPSWVFSEELTFEGKTMAQVSSTAVCPYTMEVDKLLVSIGDFVKEEQPLIEYHLDVRQRRSLHEELYNEAGLPKMRHQLSTLEHDRANISRQRSATSELVEKGLAPASELSKNNRELSLVQRNIANLKKEERTAAQSFAMRLEELKKSLGVSLKPSEKLPEQFFLTAPKSGTVINLSPQARPGGIVPANVAAVTLAQLNPIQVEIQVHEDEIMRLHIGQPVTVELANDKKIKLDGKIVMISWEPLDKRIAMPSFYNVYIDVTNPDAVFKPGYKVYAKIEAD